MSRITTYFRDIRNEFTQITWPDRRTAVRLTLLVVAFSAVFAAFLGAIDYVFGAGIRALILS